ncbi:putative RING-variant domain containing protein [Lyophyllum shimeji]|uniref:RING-variant domain containing protein n=1 Tax=Lyophyllum shimeji TaxID=47721 RepID=A0A9P3UQQ2_LYOSH|nr:putative RING-variant domain containing protein [Lyophyllum shimeji]
MSRRTQTPPRVPTVNDLRVKLCYICREEENYDAPPEDPPRAWTHPCTCTLVAHESCLLRWIQTSQGDPARAPNALKCPQCGTKYELVSYRPRILRLLGLGNAVLQRIGRLLTLCGAAGVVAVFASGIYIVLTAYGAWAVRQFLGEEMFNLLLTDNPSNWPWTTFINLPSIPLSLIAGRFQTAALIPTLVPILLVWPPAPPIRYRLTRSTSADTDLRFPPAPARDALWTWPPTPAVFGFVIVPLVRVVYRRVRAKVQTWVLGAQPPSARLGRPAGAGAGAGGAAGGAGANDGWDGWPIVIRIRAHVVGEEGGQPPPPPPPQPQQQVVQVQQGVQAPGLVHVHNGEGEGEGEQPQEGPQPPAAVQGDEQLPDQDQALAAAEQQISISASSLGRRVGGALLIPWISNRMGALLLSLSKHSDTLRRFLAVRPAGTGAGAGSGTVGWPYGVAPGEWEGLGPVRQVRKALGMVWAASWRGTRTWAEADPVWWRNAIGLGLFVVAKDCVELLHLYLALRELESRHVRSRDFAGVDIRELDLVPGFPGPRKPSTTSVGVGAAQVENHTHNTHGGQGQGRARSLPRGM